MRDLYHSELGDLRNPNKFKMSYKHNNVFWTETELDAISVFIVNFGNFKGKYSYSYQQTCSVDDNRQAWAVRGVTNTIPVAEGSETTEVAAVKESVSISNAVDKVEPATAAESDTEE